MKKLLGILLLCASSAFAAPFLTSDPVTTGDLPATYTVSGIGGPFTVPASAVTGGGVQLHVDLSTVPMGTYTVTVTATDAAGGVSAASAPFTFTLASATPAPTPTPTPAAPVNLSISPK